MSANGEDLTQFDISEEEKNRLVAEVIRYILFKTYQSSGCPIKRDELTQIITKNYRQRALPAAVIDQAKEKLAATFGYELKELLRTRSSSKTQTRYSQQSSADMRSYIVISKLPTDVYKKYVEDISKAHLSGFTFVIVSIVQLAGGKISEVRHDFLFFSDDNENLWHHMRRMGLHETDENHPALGNVKFSLEALVQQRYIQKDKVNGPEGNTIMYELAERALDGEVSMKIKEYISQIVSKDLGTVEVDDDDDE